MSGALRLFMIAGEPSGDLLGAALIGGLRQLVGPDLLLEGVGGPAMAAGGFQSRFPMEELSVMGLTEILPRLPNLLRRIRETAAAVIAARPDALVTIDSPDFCLRVARAARKALPGLKVIHYVAPSVWAWRPGRARRMARDVDHVLALLPFEPPYMRDAGMTCDFVGHPVAAQPVATPAQAGAFRARIGVAEGQRLVLLLPGSRRGEVQGLAPVFAEVARRLRATHPDLAMVVPAAAPVAELVATTLAPEGGDGPRLLDPRGLAPDAVAAEKRAAFAAADLALAASGTVSLELAAAGTPMVIAYAVKPLTAFIIRRLARTDTATLVNIVTDSRVIPEFLAEACRPDLITPAVEHLLSHPAAAAAQRTAEVRAMELLGRGGPDPGLRAARSVLAALGRDLPPSFI